MSHVTHRLILEFVNGSQCRDDWFRRWSHVLYKYRVAHMNKSRYTDSGFFDGWTLLCVVMNEFVDGVMSCINMP